MTNKLLLSTLIASSFFIAAQANATDATGTANFNLVTPITVTPNVAMEFGNIDSVNDGTCEVNTSDVLTGTSCLLSGNSPKAGTFDISASDGNINLAVVASGTPVPGVTLLPKLDALTQTVSSGSAVVKVGGLLTVVGADATDGAKSLEYTLSVTY
jgi:hypothetical protein